MLNSLQRGNLCKKNWDVNYLFYFFKSRWRRWSSAVVFMFLLVCPVFSHIPAISFTRDELLDIRKYTPPDISPDFVYSDVLLDIVVGGAAVLFRCFRTCRRVKRAGALVKLHRRGLRTPLPSIHLANLCSLPSKTDKLLLLSQLNKDFFKLCCSVFHGNLAERRHSRQRFTSAEFPADQSRSRCRINGEIAWRRDVLLHQWKLVYRCNRVKEDVLLWSRSALH